MGKAGRRAKSGTSEEEDQRTRKGVKTKTSSKKKKASALNKVLIGTSRVWPSVGSDLLTLASDFREQPVQTGIRVSKKLCLYLAVIFLLLATLNLLGFNVIGDSLMDQLSFKWDSGSSQSVENIQAAAKPATAEEEEIPEMVGYEAKKGNKINKAKEKELACKEVDCNMSCLKKMTPKCVAKKSCRTDREKLCKRRCLKQRCDERCKDEPKYGYVEREQKMDKCKEGCQGSTAQHNKCIKKCHSEFKPCKSRCHEISVKFQCDTKKVDYEAIGGGADDKKKNLKGAAAQEEEEEEEGDADFAPSSDAGDDNDGGGAGADLDDEAI